MGGDCNLQKIELKRLRVVCCWFSLSHFRTLPRSFYSPYPAFALSHFRTFALRSPPRSSAFALSHFRTFALSHFRTSLTLPSSSAFALSRFRAFALSHFTLPQQKTTLNRFLSKNRSRSLGTMCESPGYWNRIWGTVTRSLSFAILQSSVLFSVSNMKPHSY